MPDYDEVDHIEPAGIQHTKPDYDEVDHIEPAGIYYIEPDYDEVDHIEPAGIHRVFFCSFSMAALILTHMKARLPPGITSESMNISMSINHPS